MLTVKSALQLEALKNCRVVGGRSGLDRIITSVNQMDAPDFVNWTKANQFIVTTGYFIRNDVNEQRQLILDLNEKKCAGLGIKIKRFFNTIPQVMIDLADNEGIPLIEIPAEYNISEIMNELMAEIVIRQAKLLERSHNIHDKFTKAAFKGGGLNDIAELLGGFVNNSVSISDLNWKNLSVYEHPESQIPLADLLEFEKPINNSVMQEVYEGKIKYIERKNIINGQEIKHIIYPIISERKLYGHITIWENVTAFDEPDLIAIEHAATVAGLELLKNKASSEMSKRLRTDFFTDYLSGQIKSREVLVRRGTIYGINANHHYVCLVMDVDNFTKIYLEDMGGNDVLAEQLKRRLLSLVDEVVYNQRIKAVTFGQSDQVVLLLRVDEQDYGIREITKQLAYDIKTQIYKNLNGLTISIGVGTVEEALNVHKSYANAVEALKIASALNQKKDSLLYFEDFFVEHLLGSIDRSKLKALYQDTIGKLVHFDNNNRTELVRTLETYFHCHYNLSEAAKEMFIHRNTFTYRLEKIKEILNMDLNDYNHMLKLQLAMKLKDLFPCE